MKKVIEKRSKTKPSRELQARELKQIEGGAIVIGDDPGNGQGHK